MRRVLVTLLFGGVLVCAPASAGIIFMTGNHPQANEENVQFNDPGLIVGPAMQVTGSLNQSGFIVLFQGSENLITSGGGQSRLAAQDGALSDLAISLPGRVFTDVIFNLNIENGLSGTAQVKANIFGGGSATFGLSVDGNGQNFLTILADGGTLISSVEISSPVAITDIRQIRISGATDAVATDAAAIPEPASFALVGGALAGLYALLRRRRP